MRQLTVFWGFLVCFVFGWLCFGWFWQSKGSGEACCQSVSNESCFSLSEKFDSHVHADPNTLRMTTAAFLTLRRWCVWTSVQNFTGPLVRRSCAMATSSRMNFPSSVEGPLPLLWPISPLLLKGSFSCLSVSLRKPTLAMKLLYAIQVCFWVFCLLLQRKVAISSLRSQKHSSLWTPPDIIVQ